MSTRIDKFEHNVIINGGFDFWQRGTSFTGAANEYTADRFNLGKAGAGVVDVLRSTDIPNANSEFSYHVDVTTADASIGASDFYAVRHKVEGRDFLPLNGKKFNISFWVKATIPGISCVGLRNSASDRSYVAEYTIDLADTWQFITIPINHDPSGTWLFDEGVGIRIEWILAIGSNSHTTPGVWQAGNFNGTASQVNQMSSNSNNFRIAQVMLNEGEVAGDFSHAGRTYAEELALCQRYLILTPLEADARIYGGGGGNVYGIRVQFPVQMRANPSLVNFSGATVADSTSAGSGQVAILQDLPAGFQGFTSTGVLSVGGSNSTREGVIAITYNSLVIGSVAGNTAQYFQNANVIMGWEAEL